MVKKLKNSKQLVKKASNIYAIVGAGLLVFSIAGMGYVYNNADNLNDKIDNKKDEIIASSSFNEYIQDKYHAVYDSYLNEEISTDEYLNYIDNIILSDDILSGNHQAVNGDINEEIQDLNRKQRINDTLLISSVIGLAGGVSAIVGGVTEMPIKKESDLEM